MANNRILRVAARRQRRSLKTYFSVAMVSHLGQKSRADLTVSIFRHRSVIFLLVQQFCHMFGIGVKPRLLGTSPARSGGGPSRARPGVIQQERQKQMDAARSGTAHSKGLVETVQWAVSSVSPSVSAESLEQVEPRPVDPPPSLRHPPPLLQQNLDQAHLPHPSPPEGRPPETLQPNRWGLCSGRGGPLPEEPRSWSSDP